MAGDESTGEVWVLGATGRSGRAMTAALVAAGVRPVLVGRDPERLASAAAAAGAALRSVVAADPAATAVEIARQRPAVVLNTIGPFAQTAALLARACLPASHYVDIANELDAATELLALHEDAVTAGRTLVNGAGFGVLATESIVVGLCAGRPTPVEVAVDAIPSVDTDAGVLGEALAGTIVSSLAGGGRQYAGGRLVPVRLGGVRHLTLPDGRSVTTADSSSGELHAARVASGAPSVTAASSLVPTSTAVRALLPVLGALVSVGPVGTLATRLLGRAPLKARPRADEHSWGHAEVRWADGTTREGWLRTGDAMAFTVAAAVQAVVRLTRGEGRAGAHTPTLAFGTDLAAAAGGELLL